MNPDVLKIMAVTAAALISAPLIAAAMRAFWFFGSMNQTVIQMGEDLKSSTASMVKYQEQVTRLLEEHEHRLTTIEVDRAAENRYRRSTDRPPDDTAFRERGV